MIIFILLIALILRIINLNQSLWLDEAINVLATKSYSFWGMITEYAKADFHPPGYFIILWIWTKIFEYSEIAVRIPSVIFGLLTIWIIFLIGQKLHSKTLGLVAALLLAINPLHIYYSQEARMYALVSLAVSANFFFFIKILKKEKVPIIFLILSNILVLSSDYVSYLIFPAQFIFLIISKKWQETKKWFVGFFLAAFFGIWWIPTFLSQLSIGSVTADKLPAWKLIVGEFDTKTVPLTLVKFIIGRISYPEKFIYALILIPICSLFIFLIIKGLRIIPEIFRRLLVCWLIVPIILAILISFIIPIYEYFRLIYILPVFIILTTFGVFSLRKKIGLVFLILVILVEFISSLIYLLNPQFQREDWRGLVSYLKVQKDVTILFESSGTLPPFDYYANGLPGKGALKDFPVDNAGGLIDLKSYLQNKRDVYLVDYIVEISDPKRLVSKGLIRLGYKQMDIKNFNGVGFLYKYSK